MNLILTILILSMFFFANVRKAKRTDLYLDILIILLIFLFISLFFRWDLISIYSKYVLIFLVSAYLMWIIKREKTPIRLTVKYFTIVRFILLGSFTFLNILLVKGCFPDKDSEFDFSSPLKNGNYYVVQGGTPPLMNKGHFTNNRLDKYSIDFVGLNSFGFSINKFNPKVIEDFVIYNDSVYSPCNGTVVKVEQQTDCNINLKRSQNDSIKHKKNNIVVIRTNGADLILAHLKKGSIKLAVGQEIRQSDFIGLISNAGSIEPHLHMQLIRDKEAIPFRIEGKYLHNNSILRNK